MTKIIKISLACLFILCLFDMPYGFYQLVRFLGMIGFAILAYKAKEHKDSFYIVVWLASAILINPFLKIFLGREIWNIIDIIWAIVLLISLKSEKST
jgi:hypothetical protein